MQNGALASVDEVAVGGVGRVPGWTPGVRRAGEHLIGEVVGEVQLSDRLVVTDLNGRWMCTVRLGYQPG
jgi:hypothetical protein